MTVARKLVSRERPSSYNVVVIDVKGVQHFDSSLFNRADVDKEIEGTVEALRARHYEVRTRSRAV